MHVVFYGGFQGTDCEEMIQWIILRRGQIAGRSQLVAGIVCRQGSISYQYDKNKKGELLGSPELFAVRRGILINDLKDTITVT